MEGDQDLLGLKSVFSNDLLVYTACYCEENIWKLCEWIAEHKPEELENTYAVFVSNHDRKVYLFCQRASERKDGLVAWDYHVILVHQNPSGSAVYDLDTTLSYPVSFEEYAQKTFIDRKLDRKFRVIKAENYLKHFASDRSHMKKEDGTWMSPPPAYNPISTSDCDNNIQTFISMDPNSSARGIVMTFDELKSTFHKH